MKKVVMLICIVMLVSVAMAAEETKAETAKPEEIAKTTDMTVDELNPWCGKYPISFFTKTRTAKVVPKNKWLLSLKFKDFQADQKLDHTMPSGERKDFQKLVFTTKYGWAENHQIAIGVPLLSNSFKYGSVHNNSEGMANIFIFEKWQMLKETNQLPAVSVDFWYFLPTGDPDRMLGTDDDAYKISTSISKAWKDFSLHVNPGYTWNKKSGDNDITEINAAALFTMNKKLWPAMEYNYYDIEGKGHAHDIVPGLIWKFRKGSSLKIGIPINIDSTFTFRDRAGLVLKLSQYF